MQIINKLSHQNLLRLLALVEPRPVENMQFDFSDHPPAFTACLAHLLELLPSSCHPAILLSRFPSLAQGSLTIPKLPFSSDPFSIDLFLSNPAPTPTMELLVAASAFTNCDPLTVWKRLSRRQLLPYCLSRHIPSSHLPRFTKKRLLIVPECDRDPPQCSSNKRTNLPMPGTSSQDSPDSGTKFATSNSATMLLPSVHFPYMPVPMTAHLTSLTLHLQPGEPCEWCAVLAELRALHSIHLCVDLVSEPSLLDFLSALTSRPSLSRLLITAAAPLDADTACIGDIVMGLVCLPRLPSLTLDGCFQFGRLRDPDSRELELAHLSSLSALSFLSLRRNTIAAGHMQEWVPRLACVVQRFPRIQELCLADTSFGGVLMQEMARSGMPPALRSLDLSRTATQCCAGSGIGALLCELSCASKRAHATVTELTALSLQGCSIASETALMTALGQTLKLRSLDLSHCGLRDSAMTAFSDILPGYLSLERLDVGWNRLTCSGLTDLLAAGRQSRMQGGAHRLRRLGIAGAAVERGSVEHLAYQIGRMKGLQVLDISGQQLGGQGACTMLKAFRGLRGLHGLMLSDNAITSREYLDFTAGLDSMKQLRWIEVSKPGACKSSVMHLHLSHMHLLAPWIRVFIRSGSEQPSPGGGG